MIRNLKVLGFVLGAVLAVGALMASAASAAEQGHFTSTGKVKVTGTGTETFVFQTSPVKQSLTCTVHHEIGLKNETPHGFFNPGATLTELTDTPTYTACTAKIGETSSPATVTMNGCDFLLHIGTTTPAGNLNGTYGGTADVVCTGTNQIEIHSYSSASHATNICTLKVPAQTGLSGAHVTSNANGSATVSGTVSGIRASRTGILCEGNKEVTTAVQEANTTATGTNEGGTATAISVTD